MSAHVLLNLLNKFREKRQNGRFVKHFISFATSLINSKIQAHDCKILFIILF